MVCRKERTLSDFWWREQGFMRGAEKARAQDLKEHMENDQSISVPVQLTQEQCQCHYERSISLSLFHDTVMEQGTGALSVFLRRRTVMPSQWSSCDSSASNDGGNKDLRGV
jgi:hypothetical protein